MCLSATEDAAGIITWDGSDSNVWSTTTNWVGDAAPDATRRQKVTIPNETNDPIKETKPIKKEQLHSEEKSTEKISLLDEGNNDSFVKKNISEKISPNKDLQIVRSRNINNYNILGIIIVFIITFVAMIIILDTFQDPISKIVPNIEFLLYNLYESINDVKLFLKDLI